MREPDPGQRTSPFGERVRHYRKAQRVSQAELAATVGRSHSMISAIESGQRQIHVDELMTFANALGVPPTALLGLAEGDRYADGFEAGYGAAWDAIDKALRDARGPREPTVPNHLAQRVASLEARTIGLTVLGSLDA